MKLYFVNKRWESCIEGGERFVDIQARFVPFIDQLIQAHGSQSTSIALVGHGGTYRCMLPLILQDVTFDYALNMPLTNTGYVLAELRAGSLVLSEWHSSFDSGNLPY